MSTTSSTPAESRSGRKRKGNTENAAGAAVSGGETEVNGTSSALPIHDNPSDSPYLRELKKQIRNIHKKLTASAKADAVIESHPNVPLDDLVAQKKLNNDQKAQILKKPQLQTQLAQLEEQQKQYKEFADEVEARFAKERTALIESHQAEIKSLKEEAEKAVAPQDSNDAGDVLHVISQFLHSAATMRQAEDVDPEESRAYEGVLFYLYQGNSDALDTMKNLVEGSEKKVRDSLGDEVDFTFAQLKTSVVKEATIEPETGSTAVEVEVAHTEKEVPVSSDPTIVNAGLTELEDTATIPTVQAADEDPSATEDVGAAPEQTSTGQEAANAVAESSWDPQASVLTDDTPLGEDYVHIARDPSETETGTEATPAAQQSTTNWADEAGAAAEEKAASPAVPENDGFSEVRRDRGRGRGGRGGRGFDGRGRGRGRGEFRGRGGGRGRGRDGPRGAAAPSAS